MDREEKIEIKDAVKKALSTDMVAQALPRIVHGGADAPYMLEVTITRQTEHVPAGLIEIHINKSPNVSEQRAEEVIQHALIDVFGEVPPIYMVRAPNGDLIPAYDWFDHTGQFRKMQAMGMSAEVVRQLTQAGGKHWGRNSLWLVLNETESGLRGPVLAWMAGKLWETLLGRHRELRG